jgi:glycosyltransferase involved in cell wall biosynthesis
MLNKLPIVSTNTGAAKDAITTKENGYTIEYENLDNLHEGIFFMMENNRKRIGEAAFKTAMEKYEFQIMYDNHKKLYSSK